MKGTVCINREISGTHDRVSPDGVARKRNAELSNASSHCLQLPQLIEYMGIEVPWVEMGMRECP